MPALSNHTGGRDALAAKNTPRYKIYAEEISTPARLRPKFEDALATALEIKVWLPHEESLAACTSLRRRRGQAVKACRLSKRSRVTKRSCERTSSMRGLARYVRSTR